MVRGTSGIAMPTATPSTASRAAKSTVSRRVIDATLPAGPYRGAEASPPHPKTKEIVGDTRREWPQGAQSSTISLVLGSREDDTVPSVYERVLGERMSELDPGLVAAVSVVDGVLDARLGRRGGLEVELVLDVADGGLRMRSGRQWLHLGPLRVRMPGLVRVTLAETATGGQQRVDVRMTAPVL